MMCHREVSGHIYLGFNMSLVFEYQLLPLGLGNFVV